VLSAVLRRRRGENWTTTVRIPEPLLRTDVANAIAEFADVQPPRPGAFRDAMVNSSAVVLAPGIESTLEAAAVGLNPLFLPPLNGSHLAQMIGFRKANVGVELTSAFGRTFADLEGRTGHLNGLSKRVVERCVQGLGETHVNEAATSLAKVLRDPSGARLGDRFPLGAFGAQQVAREVIELL
jgi:hypothetical protein